ncbi:hypothetical protein TUM4433_12450 [Shewanella schlegeliana]|nr:hypothetical protein TUM4433_12450 [Shewanella schlegeliana]
MLSVMVQNSGFDKSRSIKYYCNFQCLCTMSRSLEVSDCLKLINVNPMNANPLTLNLNSKS